MRREALAALLLSAFLVSILLLDPRGPLLYRCDATVYYAPLHESAATELAGLLASRGVKVCVEQATTTPPYVRVLPFAVCGSGCPVPVETHGSTTIVDQRFVAGSVESPVYTRSAVVAVLVPGGLEDLLLDGEGLANLSDWLSRRLLSSARLLVLREPGCRGVCPRLLLLGDVSPPPGLLVNGSVDPLALPFGRGLLGLFVNTSGALEAYTRLAHGSRAVLVWSPGCGYSREMVRELEAHNISLPLVEADESTAPLLSKLMVYSTPTLLAECRGGVLVYPGYMPPSTVRELLHRISEACWNYTAAVGAG